MDGTVMYGAALRVEFKVRLNPHPSLSASLVSSAQTVAKFAVAALSAQLKLNRWPLTVWLCPLSICDNLVWPPQHSSVSKPLFCQAQHALCKEAYIQCLLCPSECNMLLTK